MSAGNFEQLKSDIFSHIRELRFKDALELCLAASDGEYNAAQQSLIASKGLDAARLLGNGQHLELAPKLLPKMVASGARLRAYITLAQEAMNVGNLESAGRLVEDASKDAADIKKEIIYFDLLALDALHQKLNNDFEAKVDTVTANASERISKFSFPLREAKFSVVGYAPTRVSQLLSADSLFSPGIDVYVLEDVYVRSRCGMIHVLDKDLRVIQNASHAITRDVVDDIAKLEKGSARILPGTSALVADNFWGATYCHWVVDWLPRLAAAEILKIKPDNILCRDVLHKYQKESVEYVGHNPDGLFSIGLDSLTFCRRLVVCSTSFTNFGFRHPMQHGHPFLLDWWQSKIREKENQSHNGRLFVPRKGTRPLLNYAELKGLFEAAKFVEIEPADLSFGEQIDAFASASAVVGNHGAALANLIFCPEKTKVLEIFSPGGGTQAYMELSAFRQLQYTSYGEADMRGLKDKANNYLGGTLDASFAQGWICNI
ncbi:DUF563 domain-containing protein [Roseomonas sp. KE0001]|uniref:glycosyltransferase family 61 protein n=1 Tax=Roseomonas sp. KE0001 TaxID=2479201 RepID=UPI0018DFDC66|nr:glycosyltransferase 61 family protein [Roseomonas sp. KE0001]